VIWNYREKKKEKDRTLRRDRVHRREAEVRIETKREKNDKKDRSIEVKIEKNCNLDGKKVWYLCTERDRYKDKGRK
jgi:hypothetical protein